MHYNKTERIYPESTNIIYKDIYVQKVDLYTKKKQNETI